MHHWSLYRHAGDVLQRNIAGHPDVAVKPSGESACRCPDRRNENGRRWPGPSSPVGHRGATARNSPSATNHLRDGALVGVNGHPTGRPWLSWTYPPPHLKRLAYVSPGQPPGGRNAGCRRRRPARSAGRRRTSTPALRPSRSSGRTRFRGRTTGFRRGRPPRPGYKPRKSRCGRRVLSTRKYS